MQVLRATAEAEAAVPGIPPWRSLRFRVTAAVSVILVITLGVLFLLQYRWFQGEMLERLGLSSTPLSDVIKGSLRHAMQTRNPGEAEAIVDNVSRQPSVVRVRVLDKTGAIRVSPVRDEIGTRLPLSDETCQLCHRTPPDRRARTAVFPVAGGERVFRNVNPIVNEAACHGCHDPAQPLNGVLITDFSMAEIDRQLAAKMRTMVLAFVAAVGLAGLVIMLSMNRLAVSRLERLAAAVRALGSGRLDSRVAVGTRDEIGVLAASFNDMVDRLRRASEIREHKEMLENVLNHVDDAVVVFAPDSTVLALNRGAERIFGLAPEQVLGQPAPLLGDDHVLRLAAAATGPQTLERQVCGADAREFPALVHIVALRGDSGEPLATLLVAQDLTEERAKARLQEQLMQSERLAATGRLAAGVAHELNNPLGNVLLNANLLLEDCPAEDPRRDSARRIVANTLRCKAIVRSLLDYSRQSPADMASTDLNALVHASLELVQHQFQSRGITCTLALAPDLPAVRADARQIEQIIVNLLENAADAIDGKGGTVRVATSRQAAAARVTVQDSGPGIAPNALTRVFEPFYTTKPQGTGLGLAICHGIVERHGGRIWAESPVNGNRGAAFHVQLPLEP